jgi:hypothetical protein
MPFKRPSPVRESSQSSSNTGPPLKRLRSRSPYAFQNRASSSSSRVTVIKVYIVQTKLDPETLLDLYRVVEGHQVFAEPSGSGVRFDLCQDVDKAEVVVTAVHMRRRLERHVEWDIAVRNSSFGHSHRTTDWVHLL